MSIQQQYQEPLDAPAKRHRSVSNWLIVNVLPLGWLALLTGMFWIGNRSDYHQLYYVLLAVPTLLALIMQPRYLRTLCCSPLLIAFALFSLYTLITLSWSSTENSFGSLAKRPLYVLLLLFSAGLLALAAADRLMLCLKASAYVATIAALASLALFAYQGGEGRLNGYGALYNPLLTSHVFGAFMAMWVAYWFMDKSPLKPTTLFSLAILGAVIIATGSRTPLVALVACSSWLMLLNQGKRGLALLITGVLAVGLLIYLCPDMITSRGMSYRPKIWHQTLLLIQQAPWLGHGFDAPLEIHVAGLKYGLADPHNMLLAVLYYCGGIGLALWLALYATALTYAWRNRRDSMTVLASALLVFGLAATMTEGGAFLSRPKEHWFLIWIPIALTFAANLRTTAKARSRAD